MANPGTLSGVPYLIRTGQVWTDLDDFHTERTTPRGNAFQSAFDLVAKYAGDPLQTQPGTTTARRDGVFNQFNIIFDRAPAAVGTVTRTPSSDRQLLYDQPGSSARRGKRARSNSAALANRRGVRRLGCTPPFAQPRARRPARGRPARAARRRARARPGRRAAGQARRRHDRNRRDLRVPGGGGTSTVHGRRPPRTHRPGRYTHEAGRAAPNTAASPASGSAATA